MKSTDTIASANAGPGARQLMLAVLWSFFGVRKMASLNQDMRTLKPQWLITAAIAGAATFIAILLSLVKLAISMLAA